MSPYVRMTTAQQRRVAIRKVLAVALIVLLYSPFFGILLLYHLARAVVAGIDWLDETWPFVWLGNRFDNLTDRLAVWSTKS